MSQASSWRVSKSVPLVTASVILSMVLALTLPSRFASVGLASGGSAAIPLACAVVVLIGIASLVALLGGGARVQTRQALMGVVFLLVICATLTSTRLGAAVQYVGPILPVAMCAVLALAPRDRAVGTLLRADAAVQIGGVVVAIESIAYSVAGSRVGTLLGWAVTSELDSQRGQASFGSAVTIGPFLASLCLGQLISRGVSQSRRTRAIAVLLACLYGAAAILTQSRSLFISVGITVLALLPIAARGMHGRRRRRMVVGGFVAVGLLLGIAWILSLQSLIGLRLWNIGTGSDALRYDALIFALRRFAERPIFGYGIGSIYPLDSLTESLITAWGVTLRDPHNGFAMVAAEGGITGVMLLIAYITLSLKDALRGRTNLQPSAELSAQTRLVVVVIGMLGYAVTVGVGFLGATRSAIVFWGILWSLRSNRSSRLSHLTDGRAPAAMELADDTTTERTSRGLTSSLMLTTAHQSCGNDLARSRAHWIPDAAGIQGLLTRGWHSGNRPRGQRLPCCSKAAIRVGSSTGSGCEIRVGQGCNCRYGSVV